MNFVFLIDCAADWCYKKKLKGKAFCREHQKQIEEGKTIKAWYGKKVKKKETVSQNSL